jgi:hypothetical protein
MEILAHQQDLSNNTTTRRHIQNSSEIFQVRFNLIFSEEIVQYSRAFAPQLQTSRNQSPMHPSSSKAFQRRQEQDLKHPSSANLITTKQKTLP